MAFGGCPPSPLLYLIAACFRKKPLVWDFRDHQHIRGAYLLASSSYGTAGVMLYLKPPGGVHDPNFSRPLAR